jgi:putative tricarboxylic transport membrane protein
MLKNWRGQTGVVVPSGQHVEDARFEPPAEQRSAGGVTKSSEDVTTVAVRRRRRSVWQGILPEVSVLVLCALLYSRTGDLDTTVEGPGPAVYPRLLIGLLVVAMFVRIGQTLLEVRRARAEAGDHGVAVAKGNDEPDEPAISMVCVWQAIALSVGYVVSTLYLGWVVGTFAFLVIFLFLTGKRRLWLTIPLSAGITVGLAYVFVKVVYIALPTGVGVFDLFTLRLLQAIGAY